MNILERFKRNSPVYCKVIGTALVAGSTGIIQYLLTDHIAVRIVSGLMFAGYFLTHLQVENNDKSSK